MNITPLNCYPKTQYKTNNSLFKNQKTNFNARLNKDTISFTSNQTQNPKVKHNQKLFDRELKEISFSSEVLDEEPDIYKLSLATLWNRTKPADCAKEGLNAIYKLNTICEIVEDEQNNSKYAVVMNRDKTSGTISIKYYDLLRGIDYHFLCWRNRNVAPACIISEGKEKLLDDMEDAQMLGRFALIGIANLKNDMQSLIEKTQAQLAQDRHLLTTNDKTKTEVQEILDDDGNLLRRYTFYPVNQDVESRYRIRKFIDKSAHLERQILLEEFDSTGRVIKTTSCIEFLDDTSLPFQISSIKNYEDEEAQYFTNGVKITYSKENNLRTIQCIRNDERLKNKSSQFMNFFQEIGCEKYTFKETSVDEFALSEFESYCDNDKNHFEFYEEQGVTVGKYKQNTAKNDCIFIVKDIVGVAVEKKANQDFSSDEQVPKTGNEQETKTPPLSEEKESKTQAKKTRLEDMSQQERLKELKRIQKEVNDLLRQFQLSSGNGKKRIRRKIAQLCHPDKYEMVKKSQTFSKEEEKIIRELEYIFKTRVS